MFMNFKVRWRRLSIQFAGFITMTLNLLDCSLTPRDRMACIDGGICHLDKDHLDFFVLGDTGGLALDVGPNYLNFIKATEVQERLAKSMAELAGRQPPEFIVNTGNNVYFNGVDNVFDSRFETVFEEVYNDERLLLPWYMISGTHDHLGNISAQIEYTKYSSRWTYPRLYYKTSYTFAHQTRKVDILFIDTVILCGNSIDVGGRSLFSWLMSRRRVPNKPDPEWADEAERQWRWIDEQLRESTADYLFVVGHYPIYSISANGNVQCLIDRLDPLLRQYQVSAYISGHDHSLQFFRVDNTSSAKPKETHIFSGSHQNSHHKDKFLGRLNYYRSGVSTMHYLVSGAGSRTDFSTDNIDVAPHELVYYYPKRHETAMWKRILKAPELGFGWGGFVRIEVRNDTADLYFYVGDLDLEFLDYINRRPMIADAQKKTRKKSAFS